MIIVLALSETRVRRPATVAVLDDRARLPWRFLSRHIAIDGLTTSA